MKRTMKYCVSTPNRGLFLKPTGKWDGSKDFEFTIDGISDSEYAKDEIRKSVNGWTVLVQEAPVVMKSKSMPIVTLSITEAELYSAPLCAQDMLFVMRIMNSMGLKVKLPMKLRIDNSGADDLIHNWSIGGRTRHIEVKQYFLRELNEAGIIETVWESTDNMTSDVLTNNLAGPAYDKHNSKFVGMDEYMKRRM